MEFKDWFCLKDRESFTIDAKIHPNDARFYFGRHEIKNWMKGQLRRSFVDPGVPKIIIYGPYGSGKTQTLFHIEYYLKTEKPEACRLFPRTIHLDLEMHSKSTHFDWHLQLMEMIGKDTVVKWVEQLRNRGNLEQELKKIVSEPNIISILINLPSGGDIGLSAWRWLCGQELSTRELEQFGVTRNLGQIGSGDLVNALIGIGKLAEVNGEKIIFLMDEAEQFRNVKTGDASESLHTYLRKLSEPQNSSVGFIIAGFALTLDDMPELLVRPDIRTRLGEINIKEIVNLPAVKDVKIFLTELLDELIDKKNAEKKIQKEKIGVTLNTYPFTSSSFDLLCEFASQDPIKALPRNIIKCVNECAITAWDDKKTIIDENIVNEIAPIIFG
ncbi:MAG: hypothetical protein NC831_06960 [Candidatus Omnitrophica bacterium]|nr:hypothetical protein [Candidatus Omnitrophota bacterium]